MAGIIILCCFELHLTTFANHLMYNNIVLE